MIDSTLFAILVWAALAVVGGGAIYLLVVLVSEWRRGRLW